MDKIDQLIDALSDHIKNIIENNENAKCEVVEKTKALAELISARALMN